MSTWQFIWSDEIPPKFLEREYTRKLRARKKTILSSSNTWLDVMWNGRMVEINSKGRIRRKKIIS